MFAMLFFHPLFNGVYLFASIDAYKMILFQAQWAFNSTVGLKFNFRLSRLLSDFFNNNNKNGRNLSKALFKQKDFWWKSINLHFEVNEIISVKILFIEKLVALKRKFNAILWNFLSGSSKIKIINVCIVTLLTWFKQILWPNLVNSSHVNGNHEIPFCQRTCITSVKITKVLNLLSRSICPKWRQKPERWPWPKR